MQVFFYIEVKRNKCSNHTENDILLKHVVCVSYLELCVIIVLMNIMDYTLFIDHLYQ